MFNFSWAQQVPNKTNQKCIQDFLKTSLVEIFANSYWLSTRVGYFHKNSSVIDVYQFPKYVPVNEDIAEKGCKGFLKALKQFVEVSFRFV